MTVNHTNSRNYTNNSSRHKASPAGASSAASAAQTSPPLAFYLQMKWRRLQI